MSRLLILIPAAGRSARMRGSDKLLRRVGDQPLLALQIARARQTGQDVLITLSQDRPARRKAVAGLHAPPQVQLHPLDSAAGLSTSLRAAARICLENASYQGLMIALPDMPDIHTADLQRLIDGFYAHPDQVCRAATPDGRPGHPVILPPRLFGALTQLAGDQGAKPLLADETPHLVPFPDARALRDLDTPEAWAAWEADQT